MTAVPVWAEHTQVKYFGLHRSKKATKRETRELACTLLAPCGSTSTNCVALLALYVRVTAGQPTAHRVIAVDRDAFPRSRGASACVARHRTLPRCFVRAVLLLLPLGWVQRAWMNLFGLALSRVDREAGRVRGDAGHVRCDGRGRGCVHCAPVAQLVAWRVPRCARDGAGADSSHCCGRVARAHRGKRR